MTPHVKYRIAARTEAAGKYDPNAANEGNEDNFGIVFNAGNTDEKIPFDTFADVPEKGLLFFVADGMGGHNAGEVASEIAVTTVREFFSADRMPSGIVKSREKRASYMEKIVVEADRRIHEDGMTHTEREGMGSTLIMAWLVGNELTVTWCGDSRLYRYRPGLGIEMLSEDHSLVQDMVRRRLITYEETFGHPQGNIVTNCLGGGSGSKAEYESRHFLVKSGDILLMCSDGLSGVVFDDGRLAPDGKPYSEENLKDVIEQHRTSMIECCGALFDAAKRCDWYDNVTAILVEVGGDTGDAVHVGPTTNAGFLNDGEVCPRRPRVWSILIAVLLIIGAIVAVTLFMHKGSKQETVVDTSMNETSVSPIAVEMEEETGIKGETPEVAPVVKKKSTPKKEVKEANPLTDSSMNKSGNSKTSTPKDVVEEELTKSDDGHL